VKATKAYLAGLGTTGILIGCFLVLLTVGSALVAFNGWPGVASGDGLERVVVKNQAERATARAERDATAKRGHAVGERRAARAADRSARGTRRGSIRRAEKSRTDGAEPATGDSSSAGPTPSQPASGSGGAHKGTGGGGTHTQVPAAPDLGNTVEQASGGLGDTVEGTTGGLGDTVEGATGGLGETVSGTGEAAGQAVDDAGQGAGQVVEDTGRTVNGLLP